MTMTPTELDEYVKKHDTKMIDAKFVDFLGQWKHLTYPIERLQEGLEEGFGFDGSSVAGWRAINSSDMLMRPDPADRRPRSVLEDADALDPVRRRRSDHARVVRALPALAREARRRVSQVDRHRRHRVLRSRGRVLCL